jgi:hypothetical protein
VAVPADAVVRAWRCTAQPMEMPSA